MSKIDQILNKGNVKVLEDPDKIFDFMNSRSRKHRASPRVRLTEDAFVVELEGKEGIVEEKMPSSAMLRQMVESRGMPWSDDYEGRFEQFWTSDERVDGAGDIVRQKWDFSRYEKLSRVLHGHNWHGLPVGRSIHWSVKDRIDGEYKGPGLYQVFLFATADQNPEAEKIHQLYKARFMTETSVGFFPLKILHVEDKKEREELGLGKWGVVFEKNQLVETSTCSVACNDGAQVAASLTRLKESGVIEGDDLEFLRHLIDADSSKSPEQRNELDEAVRRSFGELFPSNKGESTDKEYATKEDLERVGAQVREEIIGQFELLRDGLVGLSQAKDSEEDPDDDIHDDEDDLYDEEDFDTDDDEDDEDLDDDDEDYEDEDDDDEDGDDAESDEEPKSLDYLDELFR